MKYCRHCGKELADGAVICPGCGCAVEVIREKKISGETAGNGKSICTMIFGILALAFFVSVRIGPNFLTSTSYVFPFLYFLYPLCELLAFTFLAVGGLKKSNGRISAMSVTGLVCAGGSLLFNVVMSLGGLIIFLSNI